MIENNKLIKCYYSMYHFEHLADRFCDQFLRVHKYIVILALTDFKIHTFF